MPAICYSRIHDLAVFLAAEEPLKARLEETARRAADATGAAACSIMLLSEGEAEHMRLEVWASTEALPADAEREGGPGHLIAQRVLEMGCTVLVPDIARSQFAELARKRPAIGRSFIGAPIAIGDATVGVLNLCNRAGAADFDEGDVSVAGVVALLIARSLQVERLEVLLRSRVAQLSLARQEQEVANRLTDGSLPPSRLAKVLARSFYRDLASAGFESGQIIEAATEIITQISGDIARHKKRLSGRRPEGR